MNLLTTPNKTITHKAQQVYLRAMRHVHKRIGSPTGRPVLINSFPKSGTHLASQIFDRFPSVRDFGYFITDATSRRYTPRDSTKLNLMLNSILPGEIVRGHVRHRSQVSLLLREKDVATYFIYRDLRDVVVSEVYYLTFMNRWHKLHQYFWQLRNDQASAISLAICGLQNGGPTGLYRDIGSRFRDFSGWRYDSNVFPVRFEDLVGKERVLHIERIVNYYLGNTSDTELLTKRINQACLAINARRSHTFRAGKTGQWKHAFSEEHKSLFKETAGNLLIELGYEKNHDW